VEVAQEIKQDPQLEAAQISHGWKRVLNVRVRGRCSQGRMRTFDSGSREASGTRSSWESLVDAPLRRLGVELEPEVRDRDSALAQGFAAASVLFGHRVLEGGNPQEAIAAFDGAILSLQSRRHVNLGHLLAVAHYLRGVAYEAKGLRDKALDDYAMTLVLVPDHEGARAARNRLRSQPRETSRRQP
jgi:hypothetical protein